MEVEAALRTLNDTLGWTGSATLSNTLAGLTVTAYILWFAWITVSQMARLRAGEADRGCTAGRNRQSAGSRLWPARHRVFFGLTEV